MPTTRPPRLLLVRSFGFGPTWPSPRRDTRHPRSSVLGLAWTPGVGCSLNESFRHLLRPRPRLDFMYSPAGVMKDRGFLSSPALVTSGGGPLAWGHLRGLLHWSSS